MPLGNGKLGVNVWCEGDSTIGLLVSHVDALDENSNLAKLGRVMVKVLPGVVADAGAATVLEAPYTLHSGLAGAQPPMKTLSACSDQTSCPATAALACDNTPGNTCLTNYQVSA